MTNEEIREIEIMQKRGMGHSQIARVMQLPYNGVKTYVFKDGRREERTWKDRSRADSWTPEMKEKARQRTLENQRRKKQWEQQPVRSR